VCWVLKDRVDQEQHELLIVGWGTTSFGEVWKVLPLWEYTPDDTSTNTTDTTKTKIPTPPNKNRMDTTTNPNRHRPVWNRYPLSSPTHTLSRPSLLADRPNIRFRHFRCTQMARSERNGYATHTLRIPEFSHLF